MDAADDIALALTSAFLAGAWTEDALARRGATVLVPRPRWLRAVARDTVALYPRPPVDRRRELRVAVRELVAPRLRAPGAPPRARAWPVTTAASAGWRWPVPRLDTQAGLARFLELGASELEWLADVRGLERRTPDEALRHYRRRWVAREQGPPRLLEAPKPHLKELQRRLLDEVLVHVPVHDGAHGFVRGRSAVTHARAHVGRRVVVRFDLEDFFASVGAGRAWATFRTAGYPEGVAHALTGLCTTVVPLSVWDARARTGDVHAHHRLGRRLAVPHLPQGAPTSPALANLAAYRLDARLSGLATSVGAGYTRYADDLVLSGGDDVLARLDAIRAAVADIVRAEGFTLQHRKTAVMTDAGRQHVCGIVVNERPNVTRAEYDLLKATLRDAAVRGPAAANRAAVPDLRAHLLGRIAWVASLHPGRGARLRERFDAIPWDG